MDESVAIRPTSHVQPSSVGQGAVVGLAVADERPTMVIGRRGPDRTADIRSAQDVRQAVAMVVQNGLRLQGFTTVPAAAAQPVGLSVQIRDLTYEATRGFFSGGIHTRAALKAVARNGQYSFEEIYRSEDEDRVMMVPTAASDEERINLALSRVIDQLLSDIRLLRFLASPSTPPAAPPVPAAPPPADAAAPADAKAPTS